MLDWLIGKKKNEDALPSYARLRANPNRGLPAELAEKEAGEVFDEFRDHIEQELREPARRPALDEPLFIELASVSKGGLLTLEMPDDGGRCLPVFSTPIRAADYIQTQLGHGPSLQYLSSTPLELTEMLRDLRHAGVETFTLDRCPRCEIFVATSSDGVKTADVLLELMAIFQATQFARASLYLDYAIGLARSEQFAEARDVAIETVGHVTMEDPRVHLLLGQLGVALKDRKLVGEAKAFLAFLKSVASERKLDSVISTGLPNFETPELPESPHGF